MTEELNKNEKPAGEAKPKEPQVHVERAKRDDAVLRDLFKKQGIEIPPAKGSEAEPKKEEPKKEEAAPAAKAQEKPPAEAKGKAPELEAALHALRRAKTPQKVIDQMSEEELLQWGGGLAKDQANVDNMSTQLGELRKQVGAKAGENKAPEGAPKGDQPKPAEPLKREGQPAELKQVVRPLMEALALPDDEEGTLVEFAQAVTQPFRTELEAQAQKFAVLNAALERLILNDARRELGSRFPQLSDEAVFGRVQARMAGLIKSGEYDSPLALMSDAARLELGDAPPAREPSRARDNGQVTTSTRPQQRVPLSREQEEDEILHALARGEKPEDLRRKYGR